MADNKPITLSLTGRIDSNNAAETEKNLLAAISGRESDSVILDAEDLEYISSAGLRILLH